MQESLEMMEYKWQQGIYNLQYMMKLVEDKKITKEDFFSITRFSYQGILSTSKTCQN